MSVTIRLSRIGKRNAPAYKIIVANTKDKRNGRPLDVLGHYNPSHNPELFQLNKERYEKWVKNGALVTNAIKKLMNGEYKFEAYTRQNEVGKEKKVKSTQENQESEDIRTEAVEQESTQETSDESADEPIDAASQSTKEGAEQPQE